MITAYWIVEYLKVLCGYLFLLFLWPSVVFRAHLRGRGPLYQFSFCVTAQVVLVNTAVLVLGLLHILNRWTVDLLFYGVFLMSAVRNIRLSGEDAEQFHRLAAGTCGPKTFLLYMGRRILGWLKKELAALWGMVRPRWKEYALLAALLLYASVYFSWGAFQEYSYGASDLYTHHAWISGLMEGEIFSGGVYPAAMHCFIYALYAAFGVNVYSSLLFVAGIHIVVLLLSVYALLREGFRWRYTPFFVLVLFLVLDVRGEYAYLMYGMARLQWTIPQEFGLYTLFLCALYLIRYIKRAGPLVRKGSATKGFWDENLLLFALALAASVAIHFYATIMAFFLCLCVVLFAVRKVFARERFVPLLAAVLCGVLISALPMVGALAQGKELQYSLNWAMNVTRGTEEKSRSHQAEQPEGLAAGEAQEGISARRLAALLPEGEANSAAARRLSGESGGASGGPAIFRHGYGEIYGPSGAAWILGLSALTLALWLGLRLAVRRSLALRGVFQEKGVAEDNFDGYLPVLAASVVFMVLFAAPYMGLPELIFGPRLCVTEHLLILAVAVMPLDMLFFLAAALRGEKGLHGASVACTAAIWAAALLLGCYHGYLYYEITRYKAAVMVSSSITRTLPKDSYTIVSTTDELYQISRQGRHEELLTFIQESGGESYTLPTEHVFLFVEKKPLQYAQMHFHRGGSWLAAERYPELYRENPAFLDKYPEINPVVGVSQCPNLEAFEISEEAARSDADLSGWRFEAYRDGESRTILESKLYDWCRRFDRLYPYEMSVYYEDDDFVCYYFRQNTNSPYELAIGEE